MERELNTSNMFLITQLEALDAKMTNMKRTLDHMRSYVLVQLPPEHRVHSLVSSPAPTQVPNLDTDPT